MNTTDVENIEFVAVLEPTHCDISVFINFLHPEYLRTLNLKLISDDDDGGVIYSLKLNDWKTSRYLLNSVLLPFPTLPLNNKNYVVQLDSTLSKSTFSYSPQSAYFSTNKTFHLIKMAFKPELKFSDSEIKYSYSTAIFIIILFLIFWCRESILTGFFQLQNNSRITLPEFLNHYSQQSRGKENEKTFIEFEPGLTVVKRKFKPRKM